MASNWIAGYMSYQIITLSLWHIACYLYNNRERGFIHFVVSWRDRINMHYLPYP